MAKYLLRLNTKYICSGGNFYGKVYLYLSLVLMCHTKPLARRDTNPDIGNFLPKLTNRISVDVPKLDISSELEGETSVTRLGRLLNFG